LFNVMTFLPCGRAIEAVPAWGGPQSHREFLQVPPESEIQVNQLSLLD
jgi:hypothetical protein